MKDSGTGDIACWVERLQTDIDPANIESALRSKQWDESFSQDGTGRMARQKELLKISVTAAASSPAQCLRHPSRRLSGPATLRGLILARVLLVLAALMTTEVCPSVQKKVILSKASLRPQTEQRNC